jgi:hypothetical protein
MIQETAIQNTLYLKQKELWKNSEFCEVVPVNFNYQGLVVVSTGIVDASEDQIIYQTYSCDCGPQPTLRGAILEKEVSWSASKMRQELTRSANPKEVSLAEQTFIKTVYVALRHISNDDKLRIARTLQKRFGENRKISFFD